LGGIGADEDVQRYVGFGRKVRINRMVMSIAPITVLGIKWSDP
jgi:hypothetical protein